MTEHIVETFGIVQDFADLHGDMSTPLYHAIMDVMLSRQREEIVRCRDCAHHDHGQCLAAQWSTASLMPAHSVKPDGFCSCGIRKNREHCVAGPVYVPLSDEEKDILGDMPALRKLFENMGARFE